MKRTALIGTLIASLAVGSAAIAGPYDRGRGYDRDHDRDRGRYSNYDHRDHRDDRGNWDRRDYRGNWDHRDYRDHRYGTYYRPNGYYSHRWVRGERLPVAFYARPYVIADYRGYGLHSPPRGYHWVRVNGDAVLAAIATGIVLDSVFNFFD
jgi:Ni/Co efflux regulator RcnB